ncbi:MAG: hypothetical protein A4E28_03008 [Methanocella sp. PtaU1.Bin125]|nr:MAG: hypothetical protein A4E28_03008 [Methanocella sp. PtaU1.Bin125]
MLTSIVSGMLRVWIWKISLRPDLSGTRSSISRSNRPGRRSALSIASGRFVAPITITFFRLFSPSIRESSCATTRRSTSPVTSARLVAIESSSSMKMMAGELFSASLNTSRRCCSDSP